MTASLLLVVIKEYFMSVGVAYFVYGNSPSANILTCCYKHC